jgi:hypothetical protein
LLLVLRKPDIKYLAAGAKIQDQEDFVVWAASKKNRLRFWKIAAHSDRFADQD